jgi:hypothetical protein
MDTHDHAEHMEDTLVVFCVRNGRMFCNRKEKLETIIARADTQNICSVFIRDFIHSAHTHSDMAELLPSGYRLLSTTRSFMVSGQYIHLCDPVIPGFLLFKKEP